MNLPIEFEEKMQDLLGGEYNDYLKCYEEPRHYGLRVNTSKISIDRFLEIAPWPLRPIPWIENGFYYDGEKYQPAKHPYYFAGLYYLQEPSAMTPANRLPIEAGDRVLDVCAAPGGKATELGAKLNGSGVLIANDLSNSRARGLLKNIELFGIGNVLVLSEEPGKLVNYFPEYFDKILIDAPCSGEGMFRKDRKMVKAWEEHGPEFFVKIQRSIITQAAQMLKPGGMLLYSTCTFSPEEDEGSIAWFLQEHPDFRMGANYAKVGLTPHFLIFDEYVAFMDTLAKKEWEEVMKLIRIIIMKGRQAGYFIILACQRPDAKYLGDGVRDQFGFRVALGSMSASGYTMMFGSIDKQFKEKDIAGRGYVNTGNGVVTEFYAPYVDPGYDFFTELSRIYEERQQEGEAYDRMYENGSETAGEE